MSPKTNASSAEPLVISKTNSSLDEQLPVDRKQPSMDYSKEIEAALAPLRAVDPNYVWIDTGETDILLRGKTVQTILATYGVQSEDIVVCTEPIDVARLVIVKINATTRRELWLKYDESLVSNVRPWPREVILAATVERITGSIYCRRDDADEQEQTPKTPKQ